MAKNGYREPGHLTQMRHKAETSPGREILSEQKSRRSKSREKETPDAPQFPGSEKGPSVHGPGATETVKIARRHRMEKQKAREQQARFRADEQEIARVVGEAVPAGAPTDHMLPPASRASRIADFVREVEGDAAKTAASVKVFFDSVRRLAGAPRRLLRVVWLGQQHA